MDFLPWKTVHRIVSRYDGDHRIRTLPCAEHFRTLAFAQLTYRESLRDIEACLSAQSAKLYHMGIRSPIKRSTLADAKEGSDWRIYAEFAQWLIAQARKLYAEEDLGLDLSNTVYALRSTTIDLCLSMFPWAPFRSTKAAVKMHTLLDLRGNILSFIHVSDGKLHDVNALDLMISEPAAIYVMDRAYLDFERLVGLHEAGAFYVTRAKSNADLRRIRYKDPETEKTLVFLTNLFGPSALTICELYKARWQVELFFKWIKQHLRIKKFYGTSENAVKVQIWTAVSVYVLVAIIKKRLDLDASLYTSLQVFSVTLFEKIPLKKDLFDTKHILENGMTSNQLNLFNN